METNSIKAIENRNEYDIGPTNCVVIHKAINIHYIKSLNNTCNILWK